MIPSPTSPSQYTATLYLLGTQTKKEPCSFLSVIMQYLGNLLRIQPCSPLRLLFPPFHLLSPPTWLAVVAPNWSCFHRCSSTLFSTQQPEESSWKIKGIIFFLCSKPTNFFLSEWCPIPYPEPSTSLIIWLRFLPLLLLQLLHSAPCALAILLFFEHSRHATALGPWNYVFPLPNASLPQISLCSYCFNFVF